MTAKLVCADIANIRLPELPAPFETTYCDVDQVDIECYSETQMRAYAEQAVREALEAQKAVAWVSNIYGVDLATTSREIAERTKAFGYDLIELAIIPKKG